MKIVLDTNVCLDLFVFQDPRWEPIRRAMIEKNLHPITSETCRNEWLRVLHYAHLPINDDNRPHIITSFDTHISLSLLSGREATGIKLPVCKDKDDQKFLACAYDNDCAFLITKDKALLKLSKRCAKLNLAQVCTPEKFLEVLLNF